VTILGIAPFDVLWMIEWAQGKGALLPLMFRAKNLFVCLDHSSKYLSNKGKPKRPEIFSSA
jgi:hypothetical protein